MVSGQTLGEGAAREDAVATFQLDNVPVRGQIAELSVASLDPILKRHDYPPELARLLGEALLLSVLVGASLKFEGKLLVQAEGDGPVSMLVAEYSTNGSLRGYARRDADRWDTLMAATGGARPAMPDVFGTRAALGLILIHDDPSMRPYQGIVPLDQPTLAECAAHYFRQSEQVPTHLSLAVGTLSDAGAPPVWRGGGLLTQKIAGEETGADADDCWQAVRAKLDTLSDAEVLDPDVPPETLLYRLFHEDGVRLGTPAEVADACSCNEARLRATLSSLPDEGLRDLVEPDGSLSINCQFCNRHYSIPLAAVTETPDA